MKDPRTLVEKVWERHVVREAEGEREPFAAAVAERLAGRGTLVVDYVRLNMLATRSA